MTPEKVAEVVKRYRDEFITLGIPQQRMDSGQTLGELTSAERLAHAHFLLDGILEYAQDPEKKGKTGWHLASVQMILSFENWFSLQQLMDHNRPDES